MSELNVLYDLYMDRVEEQIAAVAAMNAAEVAMRARPEYQAWQEAVAQAEQAAGLMESALDAVEAAVASAFQETGERQPHPYAGIIRVDTKAKYNPHLVLKWLRARPDYKHLIVPESVDRKGFEKLARALTGAGAAPTYDNGGIDFPLVDWEEVPVVRVKVRED